MSEAVFQHLDNALDNTNPISWYKAIARGLSRFCQTKTFLMEPSRLPTSIRFVPVSVQYIFLPIASTASPSVVNRPEKTLRCISHCSSSQLTQKLPILPFCNSSGSCFMLCPSTKNLKIIPPGDQRISFFTLHKRTPGQNHSYLW